MAKTKIKPKTKVKPKSKTKPRIKPRIKVKPKIRIKTKPKTKAKIRIKPKTKTRPKIKPKAKPAPKTKIKPEAAHGMGIKAAPAFKDEKTPQILATFEKISRIPRCSKHEAQIGEFLLDWGRQNGFQSATDACGNIVIRVPATPGFESAVGVIIQGHLDMVCEKTPDSSHDFSRDPIEFVTDGEWLKANKTTLGADNGIAIAIGMELALDKTAAHPELELLFTVDEETGLTGANNLGAGFIRGRTLLNLDSEDEGVFTVGCAGGRDTHIALPLEYLPAPIGTVAHRIKASGMTGGHSGVNIHDERANAIRVLTQALQSLRNKIDLRLASISGGTAHNAIPRDAEAVVYFAAMDWPQAAKMIVELEEVFRLEFKNTDPNLKLSLDKVEPAADPRIFSERSATIALSLLLALPHGVAAMSTDIKGLVETSNNLANIRCEDEKLKIITSQRSSVMSRLQGISDRIEAVCRLAGAEYVTSGGYPSWQPNMASPLLARCRELYQKLFAKEAHVEAIHAGLECGIIGAKYSGMDMISFGPTLKNPHSPDEKILIASIGKIWYFLLELLKNLK